MLRRGLEHDFHLGAEGSAFCECGRRTSGMEFENLSFEKAKNKKKLLDRQRLSRIPQGNISSSIVHRGMDAAYSQYSISISDPHQHKY